MKPQKRSKWHQALRGTRQDHVNDACLTSPRTWPVVTLLQNGAVRKMMVNIREAKANLSKLPARVNAGAMW